MVRIIAFHGPKLSGKNTGAKALAQGKELAFADALKSAAMHLFNLTYEQCYDERLKEVVDERWGMTPRQILQILGTDCIRKMFGGQHFVKLMRVRIQEAIDQGNETIVITDCRFFEEAEMVLSLGGIVIKIHRPSLVLTDQHASEQPLDDHIVTTTIVNEEGQMDEFLKKVVEAVDLFYTK